MMKELAIQIGAAVLTWVILALTSYVVAAWCFDYQFRWSQAMRWAAAVVVGVVISFATLYVVSRSWAATMMELIIPAIVCICALQTLLYSLRKYFMAHDPAHIHNSRFYLTLIALYVFFMGGSWGVIVLKNRFLIQSASLCYTYFIYGAVVGSCILTLLTGRSKNKRGEAEKDATIKMF